MIKDVAPYEVKIKKTGRIGTVTRMKTAPAKMATYLFVNITANRGFWFDPAELELADK